MTKKESVEVELNFPGKLKNEPVFYYIMKNFDIIPNILEASFSTDMGWAIVTFEGEKKELAKLFDYLRSWDVEINLR